MLVLYLEDDIMNSLVMKDISCNVGHVSWIIENYKYQRLRRWEASKGF